MAVEQDVEVKICCKCNQAKRFDEFRIHGVRLRKDGMPFRASQCAHCDDAEGPQKAKRDHREYLRKYYHENKEKWAKTEDQKEAQKQRRRERYKNDTLVREAAKESVRAFYRNNPRVKKKERLRKYNLTLEEFDSMLANQNKSCAICGNSDMSDKTLFPVVDHCHTTGKVRGLLCMKCNMGLGSFNDSPEKLANAIEYLRKQV